MKKTNYIQIIKLLTDLNTSFPQYNMGRHLATALDGYGDVWGITDKELLFALTKYKSELEMDVPHTDDEELDEIIKQGMNLDDILKDDNSDEQY
jgi:hypothetical protein